MESRRWGHVPRGWLRRWHAVALDVKSIEAAGDGSLAAWRGGRGQGRAPVGGGAGAAPTTGGCRVGSDAGEHRELGSTGPGVEEEGRRRNPSDTTVVRGNGVL
jgi:hypothetical protein